MKRGFHFLAILSLSFICMAIQNPNDLPHQTIARSECCGPTCKGIVPQGSLNQVFFNPISPSELKCYSYEITKPGTYLLTRDFQHVTTKDGDPLIRILSNNVTIDFQMFSLHHNIPVDQIDGTNPLLKSNLIEIGNGIDPISNVTILNGTLRGTAGTGIIIKPNVSNVTINSMRITDCLAGGIAISGAHNIAIECCTITNHGSRNIIDSVTNMIIPQNGNLLDNSIFPLTGTAHLGAFGILGINSTQIAIKDSEVLSCGATDLENDVIGIYAENCKDIEVIRSSTSGHSCASSLTNLSPILNSCNQPSPNLCDPPYLITKGMFFKNCKKGFIDCCLVTCNKGAGVVGIDLIESDIFYISNSHILDNQACGAWLHIPLPIVCPNTATNFDLFTRCSLCGPFVDSGTNVNMVTAYCHYKVGLTLPQTSDTNGMTNWQKDMNADCWTTFMEGMHTIDHALDYYTNKSKAYGIRLFDTNYVTLDRVSVVDTTALHNSAFGIFLDRNICTANKGLCNTIKLSKVVGTKAFADVTPPNETYAMEIKMLFGSILDETMNQVIRHYESISQIGRGIGIELRNCVESTVLHNNLIKGNGSQYVFGAGLFLNRSSKSDLFGNRIESNYGFDLGYGLLNRTVDPTDLTASTTLFANGLIDRSKLIDPASQNPSIPCINVTACPAFYISGVSTYDKNINYGMAWSADGTLSIQHAYTTDLDALNNIGTHENIQIFFNAAAQQNLPCTIETPDIIPAHLV